MINKQYRNFQVTIRLILIVILCCCSFDTLAAIAKSKDYTVAIVPQLPKEITHKNWGPFIYELSKRTGLKFKLLLYSSFREFENSFSNGDPDFVYLNPYHQLIAHKTQGYIPLIRDDSNRLTGILVVRKDTDIDNIEQLNGKKIAFPSPLAFGASLYMRAALYAKGVSVAPLYVKSHNNVYRNVILGSAIAGGGVNATLQAESRQIQNELKVIFQLPGVASHPFSAHPRIPQAVTSQITKAWTDLYATPAGRELLNNIHIPKPILAEHSRDYKPLEKLRLERFSHEDPQVRSAVREK